jgi:outer membrane cobalamin receptor
MDMHTASEKPGHPVIDPHQGVASDQRIARLALRGLLFCAAACASAAEPPPAGPEPDRPGELAASSGAEWAVKLDKVVVTPSRFGIAEERVSPNVTLTKDELQTLPQFGEDLYRTIARLPGLAADDFSAKFWVRGAPNSQMLARFDGVDLIEPFHLKDFDGSMSIVDLRTIGSIDVVTGGFTTEYGDRLAGVLKMDTREIMGPKPVTTLGLSVGDVSATNQGGFADDNGHWMVAARSGYLDLIARLGGGNLGFSAVYYDLTGKVEYRLNPHQTLSLHVLYAGDTFEQLHKYNQADLRSSYDSAYVWGRWQGDFGDRLSGESVLSLSQLDWHRKGSGLIDYGTHQFLLHDDRRLDTVGLRQDWTLNLTERALVRTGCEFKSGEARYNYALSREMWSLSNGNLLDVTRTVNYALRPDGDYAAAYVAPRLQPWTPLIIEPGLRFEHHSSTGDSGWSPRLNASLALGHRTTLRAAWGIYEQAQGLQELSLQDRETKFSSPERAEQRVLGVSHKLESGVTLRLEAYERLSSHLRPHWENMIAPFNVFPESLYDRIRLDPARGRARGVELITEHRGGRLGWGASYVCAVSEEQVGGRWIPRNRDQRHTFYADMTYAPARDWQLSCAWQYHTGWPTTDINYYLTTLNNGSLIYSWAYGPYNGRRAPAYHRLDLRATRNFRLKHSTLRVFIDVFNAYNRQNEDGYDSPSATIVNGQLIVDKAPLKMLPVLPSFGLSWEF